MANLAVGKCFWLAAIIAGHKGRRLSCGTGGKQSKYRHGDVYSATTLFIGAPGKASRNQLRGRCNQFAMIRVSFGHSFVPLVVRGGARKGSQLAGGAAIQRTSFRRTGSGGRGQKKNAKMMDEGAASFAPWVLRRVGLIFSSWSPFQRLHTDKARKKNRSKDRPLQIRGAQRALLATRHSPLPFCYSRERSIPRAASHGNDANLLVKGISYREHHYRSYAQQARL